MASPNRKFTDKDASANRDAGEFQRALHAVEGRYGEGDDPKDLIDANREAIDGMIADVRPDVFRVLDGGKEGKLTKKIHGLDVDTKEKSLNPGWGRRIARSIFGRIPLVRRLTDENPHKGFKEEQPVMSSNPDFKGSMDDAIVFSSNREVVMPAIMDPSTVWDHEIAKDAKNKKLLSGHLGKELIAEPEGDSVLTYAMGFLEEKVPSDKVHGFLEKALGLSHAKPGNVDDAKEKIEFLTTAYNELTEAAKKLSASCHGDTPSVALHHLKDEVKKLNDPSNTAAPYQKAESDLSGAKTDADTMNRTGSDDQKKAAQSRLEFYTAQFEKIEKKYQDAKHKVEEFEGVERHFKSAVKKYNNEVSTIDPMPDKDKDADLHTALAMAKTNAAALETGFPNTALENIEKHIIAKDWKSILKHSQKTVKAEEEKTKLAGGEHHEVHNISSSDFLYKIYYAYVTLEEKDGGSVKDGAALNDIDKRKMRNEAALFTKFAISDAKDMSVFAANRARAEGLAKKLPKHMRPKFMPDFNEILHNLRFSGEARPFAKLELRKDIDRKELRHMLKHGQLDHAQIPLLIAHLQKILEGYENTYIQSKDIPYVMAMIRNFRLLHEEKKYNDIMNKPGKFDDKLKELLKEDNAVDAALEQVDQSLLFSTITDKNVVKEHKKAMIEEMKENVKEGKIPVDEAIKMMKEHGVETGYGTWAKFMAIRSGQNIKNIWKNTVGRGPFAWAWRSTKASGSWIKNSWLGKLVGDSVSYSLNPKTMKDNYSVIPPIFKSHGHGGHGGDDHGAKH